MMSNRFVSKVGNEILIPLVLIFGVLTIVMIINKAWFGLMILMLPILFVFHILKNTHYTIEEGQLKIVSGIFRFKPISILSIKTVSKSNNMISSPANSLDRLAITYGESDLILVSPKNVEGFVESLHKVNPKIAVNI